MSTQSTPAFARRNCDGLAQIGLSRFDVAGIRFLAPTADTGTGGDGGTGGDAAAQAAAAAQASADAAAAAKPPWGDDPTKFDPDKMWKLAENLRGDITAEKAKRESAIAEAVAKATEDASKKALADFAKLLSGEQAPETDPAKLNAALQSLQTQSTETASKLTAAEQQVKAGQVALQVALHAPTLGANTALLLANEQFKTSIGSVEPTDEAAIKAAITKALQDNAALKQPPQRSGDVAPTGPTVQTLESLLATAEKAGDAAESIVLKRRIAELRNKS
ncbi:hypothetical protein [Microbacterium allomyrinae]|uniref:Scaffolding protein n=1 Tax=Microbacterium allomyrinae TaxID=2830666 RepID=A0A9X1S3D8_9MICO|nr:hypothetical protein [Microbacterium allomyrinae]MCC2033074.1 hypothetical protein [Microbacterium allomyrinae]